MANQRWKVAERRLATLLQKAAGKVRDPILRKLVTTTGRVGHLTELGFDVLVGNPEDGVAYVGEAKRRKTFLGADALRALLQVARLAVDYGRTPLLGFTLADDVPAFIQTERGKHRLERDWVVMPLPHAIELIEYRRMVAILSRRNAYFREMVAGYQEVERDLEKGETDGPAD